MELSDSTIPLYPSLYIFGKIIPKQRNTKKENVRNDLIVANVECRCRDQYENIEPNSNRCFNEVQQVKDSGHI